MEMLILVVTLVFELAIAVYSMVTKQSRHKIKSWTRIAMFIGFIMLSLGNVVVWEYTWGLFAGLLFLLAFKEMVALLRKQTPTPRYKTFSTVWKLLLLALTIVITLVPVLLFPQHRLPQVTGPYAVATATYSYVDKNRIEEFTDQESIELLTWNFGILNRQTERILCLCSPMEHSVLKPATRLPLQSLRATVTSSFRSTIPIILFIRFPRMGRS